MVGLSDGEKKIQDMRKRLDRILACDRRTDGRTDGRTDILPRHSPRYAYASRGKNTMLFAVDLKLNYCCKLTQ